MEKVNKICRRANILILALVIFCPLIQGQAPEKLNYQAVLRDGSGNVRANETVGIVISILQGSASGTEVFSEAHAITTNDFGLVSVSKKTSNPLTFC